MLTWWMIRGMRGRRSRGAPAAMFLQAAILALLRRGPTHGYQLLTSLVDEGFLPRQPDIGHLYRVLRAMEAFGWVVSEWSLKISGPLKRVYSLTPAGEEALKGMLENLKSLQSWLNQFVERCEKEIADQVG